MSMVASSNAAPQIGSFEFHGDTVTVVTNDRGSWAVLGQLCRNLTLDPEAQRQALSRKSWSQGRTCITQVRLPEDDRARQHFLIHERIVPMWLANITTSRITDEAKRDKVERAQVELADALYNFVSGRPSAPVPRPEMTKLEALRAALESEEGRLAAEARVKELEAPAAAWNVLADASGDYSLRDAAHILNRDPGISTGQHRLMKFIRELEMVDRKGVPYAKHNAHLTERPQTYLHPQTREVMLAKPQIRITVRGLQYLHGKLGGVAPLQYEQPGLDGAA